MPAVQFCGRLASSLSAFQRGYRQITQIAAQTVNLPMGLAEDHYFEENHIGLGECTGEDSENSDDAEYAEDSEELGDLEDSEDSEGW